jgi:hypothetical protein
LPLAEIGGGRPLIEATEQTPIEAPPLPAAPPPEAKMRQPDKLSAAAKPTVKAVDAVIPLVHAPDDPGPDSATDADPVPETTSPPPLRDAWQRLRELFR